MNNCILPRSYPIGKIIYVDGTSEDMLVDGISFDGHDVDRIDFHTNTNTFYYECYVLSVEAELERICIKRMMDIESPYIMYTHEDRFYRRDLEGFVRVNNIDHIEVPDWAIYEAKLNVRRKNDGLKV